MKINQFLLLLALMTETLSVIKLNEEEEVEFFSHNNAVNSNYNYICAADELTQPNSFLSLAKSGVALQLKAIYDGSNLIQRFGAEEGNYMHIIFKTE